jgi:exopolysaccharide biosynthesis predicted pyruvyltransferase EpsI
MDKISGSGAPLLILPHSSYGMVDHMQSYQGDIIFFCRELETFERMKNVSCDGHLYHFDDIGLFIDFNSHDLAVLNYFRNVYRDMDKRGVLVALRGDREAKQHELPPGLKGITSHDISTFAVSSHLRECFTDPLSLYNQVSIFFIYLERFDTIATDRLHVAIAALSIGKQVNLYDNSYGKIRSVYNYSLRRLYRETCRLCE